MSDCVFCKIASGELPSFKIYEDKHFYAFLDRQHFTDGHTLLIPKEHFRFIWNVPDEYGYMKALRKIVNGFKKNLGIKKVDTLTMGQMIKHAHWHIIPRTDGDWDKVLKEINKLQHDTDRQVEKDFGNKVANEFSLNDN